MSAPVARRRRTTSSALPAVPQTVESRDPPLLAVDWSPAYIAFLVYIFNIVSYRLPEGAGTVTMGAALLTLPLERRGMRMPPPVYFTLALLGWAFVGFTSTQYPGLVWNRLIEFAKIVGVMFVAVNVLTTSARLRFFLLAFLGSFAYFPVRGALITYFAYGGGVGGRAAWNYTYENPNDLAGMCLLVFAMAVGMFVVDRRSWIRASAAVGMLILPLVVLLSQSRGAFIALLAVVAIALRGYWRRGKLLLGAAAAIVVLVFATPDSVWKRLGTIKDVTSEQTAVKADDEGSARQRMEIWKVSSTVFAENPLLGVGLGAYPPVHFVTAQRSNFDPTARGARDNHSTYLNLLAETGLPGLLLFLGVVGSALAYARRTRRMADAERPRSSLQLYYLELGLIGYLVAGIWGTYGQLVLTYLHIAVIYAASRVLRDGLAPAAPRIPPALPVRRPATRGMTRPVTR